MMDDDNKTLGTVHKKPEMILFYNKIKAGVDKMDQMCAFFYNIFDISSPAGQIGQIIKWYQRKRTKGDFFAPAGRRTGYVIDWISRSCDTIR